MVLDLQNKPYGFEFLQDIEVVQLALIQKYDLPFVTEGGRIYESYQELFQLELIQCGLLEEEDELIFKQVPSDFIFKAPGDKLKESSTLEFEGGSGSQAVRDAEQTKGNIESAVSRFAEADKQTAKETGGPTLAARIMAATGLGDIASKVTGTRATTPKEARYGLKREAGEKIEGAVEGAKKKVGEAADVVGGKVGPAREAVGKRAEEVAAAVGGAVEGVKGAAAGAREKAGEIAGAIPEGAEAVGQAAGVFAGKISNQARDMKAKMTSAATGLKVTGSALSRGFKAGLDSQKAPTSPIYKRSPQEYWNKRGSLATDKANADVKFNDAASAYEKDGDESAFEEALTEYGASITEVDRKAKEMGSSFEAVASHVEALGQGRTRGVMPPSDGFPDAATKSGESGSGEALFNQTSKNLKGGLWSQKVVQRGEAWSQGKGKEESRFKGPGAEGAEAVEAQDPAAEEAGLREALKNPDEAIQNLPKGSNIESGDREYLTKPGQQPPEGVQVHFGDPNAQGQRSRFYSKTEANIRRLARRQKDQGRADELGPEGAKSPEARRARAEQAKAGVEAAPDPLAGGVGSVSESDIDSFIQGLKDRGILKVPEDEEKAREMVEEASTAAQGGGEQLKLPGFNGEAEEEPAPSPGEGEAKQPRLPGFDEEADQQEREDEIVAERDKRRAEGQASSEESTPSEEPSAAPTPEEPTPSEPIPPPEKKWADMSPEEKTKSATEAKERQEKAAPDEAPSGVPKNVQSALNRAERLANQGGKVAAQYSRLINNVDKFATQAANGDVRMDDTQVKGFLEVSEALTEKANASREANKVTRRKMTDLTRTQDDLENVSGEVKTLQDALNAGDDVDKKELEKLETQQKALKKKRTTQVAEAQKAMKIASENKRALSDGMRDVRRNIQDIKDNPAADAPSRNVGWRRLVNKQPPGSPIPNPELPMKYTEARDANDNLLPGGEGIDLDAAFKLLDDEGWGEEEAQDYVTYEWDRMQQSKFRQRQMGEYQHPANAEREMGSKYVPRAIKAAQKMSNDPIITAAIAGGALKLSKDTQHLWAMLDMADDLIDKQLIAGGNYSPLIYSIDSYLEAHSYN